MSMNFFPCTLASIFSHSVIQLHSQLMKHLHDNQSLHRRLVLPELHQSEFVQVQVNIAAGILYLVSEDELVSLGRNGRCEKRQSQESCLDEHDE